MGRSQPSLYNDTLNAFEYFNNTVFFQTLIIEIFRQSILQTYNSATKIVDF